MLLNGDKEAISRTCCSLLYDMFQYAQKHHPIIRDENELNIYIV
jgi:hypothetical protein